MSDPCNLRAVLVPPRDTTETCMAPPQDFEVTIEPSTGAATVRIHGDLDLSNADALTDALTGAGASGHPVVADLAGVTFIDSSAITALVTSARMLTASGNRLELGVAPRSSSGSSRSRAWPRAPTTSTCKRRGRRPVAEVQPTTLELRMPPDPQLLRVLRLVGSGLASLGTARPPLHRGGPGGGRRAGRGADRHGRREPHRHHVRSDAGRAPASRGQRRSPLAPSSTWTRSRTGC